MSKPMFSEEIQLEICKKYQNGISRNVLKKEYSCSDNAILNALKRHNITIRGIKESNISKFKINQDFFEIDKQTCQSAYILGLLASDGCVASQENCVYIELQRQDRELLEKINTVLENERPVKDYCTIKGYENSKLYFFSRKIKTDLAQYNIIPNKTQYNNDFMQNIVQDYEIDYIRGHFDGDGSIKWSNGSITFQIDSTSEKTLKHIQQTLLRFGIETKIVEKDDKSVVNLTVYRLYCYGYEKCSKIFDLFYNTTPSTKLLRMERKYNHFLDLLLKYKTHETSGLKA